MLFCYLELYFDNTQNTIQNLKVSKITSKGKNSNGKHIISSEGVNQLLDMSYLNAFKKASSDGGTIFKVEPCQMKSLIKMTKDEFAKTVGKLV